MDKRRLLKHSRGEIAFMCSGGDSLRIQSKQTFTKMVVGDDEDAVFLEF